MNKFDSQNLRQLYVLSILAECMQEQTQTKPQDLSEYFSGKDSRLFTTFFSYKITEHKYQKANSEIRKQIFVIIEKKTVC